MTAFLETETGDLVNVAAIEALVVQEVGDGWHVVIVTAGHRYLYSSLILSSQHGSEVIGQLYGQILGDEQARPLPAPTWEASQAEM